MDKKEKSPILNKEIDRFLKANKNIRDALELFKISEKQYMEAIQTLQPEAITSNKITIEIAS